MDEVRLLRLPQVRELYPKSRTVIYDEIARGLFPPPVRLGSTAAWPLADVRSIVLARIAGKPDEEIRQLVAQTVVSRKSAA